MRVRNQAIDLEPTGDLEWQTIDTALRTIAQRRGALDVLEAKWIREALRVKIWREVGCVTMAEYLERRLGYAPRTAYDRVRVATALEELPKLAAALEAGFPHSAVRALTRVCTNDNESKWLDTVRGKSVHEIENMVAGRARGSNPEDPPNPNLVGRTLPFEAVRPATEALVRDARRLMQEERGGGEVVSDDEVLVTLARAFLEGGSIERTKAPYQIAISLCDRCGAGCQESGGRKYALSRADTERACCDAQWIGSLDMSAPVRALQDVSPSTRRLVHRRARGRCEVPGCRSTRCLEIHHIIPRALGGTHDPENLILLCDGCHAAHHRGLISITGTASELVVTRKHEIAYDMIANDEVPDTSCQAIAHVSPNVGHDDGRSASGIEPTADASTSVRKDRDRAHDQPKKGGAAGSSASPETNAHASTNKNHDEPNQGDCADSSAVIEATPHASAFGNHGHPKKGCDADSSASLEASAHVSTNENHDGPNKDGRPDSTAREATTTLALEASAHVSTNENHDRLKGVGSRQLSQFERERLRSQARMALVTLGYRAGEAGKAVDLAIRYGHDTLETVIREALRSCARPPEAPR